MFPNALTQTTTSNEPLSSSEIKAPRRLMGAVRKNKVLKENVDSSQGSVSPTVSLAHLPIQKQSTKIRKRVLVDSETSLNDQGNLKKHKVRIDELQSGPPTLNVLSTLKVAPLHRTLSDKSSYLNNVTIPEPLSALPRSQSTLSSWRRSSQSRQISSDGEDADDEDEDNQDTAPSTLKPTTPTQLKALSPLIPQATRRPSAIDKKLSFDGEIFGSDSTLTSPEDDSDEEPHSKLAATSLTTSADTTLTTPTTTMTVTTAATVAKSTTPAMIATPRRGPGRPRKSLQNNDIGQKSEPAVGQSVALSKHDVALIPEVETSVLPSPVSIKAIVAPELDSKQPSPYRSLMDRVINAQNGQAAPVDQYQTSEEDVDDIQYVVARLTAKQGTPESIAGPALTTEVKTLVLSPKSDSTEVVDSPQKQDDGLFAKPTLPSGRDSGSSIARRPRRDSHASRTKPLDRATPLTPMVANPGDSRHSFRRANRPRLFQTCRDIMTKTGPSNITPNIPHIKAMLKQALKQGMGAVQETSVGGFDTSFKPTVTSTSDFPVLGWGTVIGNGKGLFPPRKEAEQARIQQRRDLVSEAYARLNLPPPRENWDVSSQVIMGGLTYRSLSGAVKEDSNANFLSIAMEDAMDRLSIRLGCYYCRRACNNRSDLTHHMQKCSMARLQTSLGNDPDGDSTASETEDQRDARCPRAGRAARKVVRAPSITSEHGGPNGAEDDEAYEEEEEEGVIMCVCGTKDDEGAMVQCDKCEVWLHLECLDLTEEEVPEEYFCPSCQGLPTPSTGGKSFRLISGKNSKRKTSQHKSSGRQRLRAHSTSSDSENGNVSFSGSVKLSSSPKHTTLRDCETEHEGEESQITDEDIDQSVQENAVSPQVVLNHDWEQEILDPASEMGYDSEYMNSFYGVTSARAIFKKARAPALMLDGSTNQESQMDLMAPLLSSDLGIDEFDSLLSEGGHPPSMGLDLCSDGDLTFSESQPYQYMQETDALFERHYGTVPDSSPDLVLTSEDTLDSEGFMTPAELHRDVDQVENWNGLENDQDPFGTDYGAGSGITYGSKKSNGGLVSTDMVDWYEDTAGDDFDFDLDGLIDLGAVSLSN